MSQLGKSFENKDLTLKNEIIKITLKDTRFTLKPQKKSSQSSSTTAPRESREKYKSFKKISKQEAENKSNQLLTLRIYKSIKRQKRTTV